MDHSGQGTRTENSFLWGLQEPERGPEVGLPWMGGRGQERGKWRWSSRRDMGVRWDMVGI